jgi:hypothetical protein
VLARAAAADPIANHAPKPAAPACTPAKVAELTKTLEQRWKLDKLELQCVAGTFGTPGYFVAALRLASNPVLERIGILAADGGPDIVPFQDLPRMLVATSIVGYRAADLDGDGNDELVAWWRRAAEGKMGSDDWLVVKQVVNHAFVDHEGPHVGIYWPDFGHCRGDWKVTPASLVVTITSAEHAPSDCLPVGTHRFQLVKGTVVETK